MTPALRHHKERRVPWTDLRSTSGRGEGRGVLKISNAIAFIIVRRYERYGRIYSFCRGNERLRRSTRNMSVLQSLNGHQPRFERRHYAYTCAARSCIGVQLFQGWWGRERGNKENRKAKQGNGAEKHLFFLSIDVVLVAIHFHLDGRGQTNSSRNGNGIENTLLVWCTHSVQCFGLGLWGILLLCVVCFIFCFAHHAAAVPLVYVMLFQR